MTHPSPVSHALASSLLATARSQGENDPGRGLVTVIQRLHVILGRLAGSAGSHSLIARALNLAHGEVLWLRAAQVTSDGLLTGLERGLVPADIDKRHEGEVILVAHIIELLHTFIGERLTLQLIREGWPDLSHQHDDDLKDPQP